MELHRSHTDSRAARTSRHIASDASARDASSIARLGDVPVDLISQAYDALDQGILVVSQDGLVSHYNAAYAQLRHIGTTELLGKPLERLDRRHSIIAYLQTGKMPLVKPADFEQRRNKETVIPIREGGRLLGSMVLVAPSVAWPTDTSNRRRPVNAKTPWTALYAMDDIIGESPAMQYARRLALSAARVDSSVLLLGESGTGKELFAHAIHMASRRSQGPFVPVDCSAITRDLLEAELFGYAPGAFTGATKDGKPGKFELAEGGTVFLDEIGEMPMDMQAKLLRVLQERRIVRVGGTTPIEIDFRLIAATNRPLEEMVHDKHFRHDLLYRLDVVRLEIPALRERGDDVATLLEHAWKTKSRELGVLTTFSPAALRTLSRYAWPGNMRELLNVVERLLVIVPKSVIELEDLPLHVRQGQSDIDMPDAPAFYLKTVVAEAEQQVIEKALRHAQGNRNAAAELVGLSRASFYRKLKEYGLSQGMREQELFENAF
jgi:sigma-54 dependent transcriptional regulator, acetoin dehydrogenase operon transcriptional activator AcoR